LLIVDPGCLGEALLAHGEFGAALPKARADMGVDGEN
jgi:hypothetical protein